MHLISVVNSIQQCEISYQAHCNLTQCYRCKIDQLSVLGHDYQLQLTPYGDKWTKSNLQIVPQPHSCRSNAEHICVIYLIWGIFLSPPSTNSPQDTALFLVTLSEGGEQTLHHPEHCQYLCLTQNRQRKKKRSLSDLVALNFHVRHMLNF